MLHLCCFIWYFEFKMAFGVGAVFFYVSDSVFLVFWMVYFGVWDGVFLFGMVYFVWDGVFWSNQIFFSEDVPLCL